MSERYTGEREKTNVSALFFCIGFVVILVSWRAFKCSSVSSPNYSLDLSATPFSTEASTEPSMESTTVEIFVE